MFELCIVITFLIGIQNSTNTPLKNLHKLNDNTVCTE